MVGKGMAILTAVKQVADIFNITDITENGKHVIRCSRCEGFPEKDRGKSFQVYATATTKAKEHIAIYCPEITNSTSSSDASLRHTLLINMPEKTVLSFSKVGQAMRKFHFPLLFYL
jgi:hypothetical protein